LTVVGDVPERSREHPAYARPPPPDQRGAGIVGVVEEGTA
jgi:hypothetical protein